MSRLQVPNQTNINVQKVPTPDAFPSAMNLKFDTGMQTVIYGGLSKLEWMAGMVAFGGVPKAVINCTTIDIGSDGTPAEHIVGIAQAILAECERIQNGAIEKQKNGEAK